MADFVPGKWGRIQKTLDNIVLDFLSSVVLLFSLLHDLSFGVQLWPGKCSQRLIAQLINLFDIFCEGRIDHLRC